LSRKLIQEEKNDSHEQLLVDIGAILKDSSNRKVYGVASPFVIRSKMPDGSAKTAKP
jgi:hypothetical protein